MRDYAKISTTLWRSKKFRSVTDEARLFYLYLHTCSHVNSVGCFVLPAGYIEADLGWKLDSINKAIDSLCKAYLIAFDREEEVVRIIDFIRHDPFTNPKHAAGAVKVALSLPDCDEKFNLLRDLVTNKHAAANDDLIAAIDTLSKGYRNPEPEPEPEPEDNSNELSSSEKKISDPHPDDIKLAEFIFAGVSDVAPKTKRPIMHKWADTIRLMRERDKLTRHEIASVFTWANKHQFWRLNILSPEKLREKFARLSAEKENDHANSSRSGNANQPSVTEQSTVGRAAAASERKRAEILAKYGHGDRAGHGGPMGPHG